jgi:hypothetical protein
MPTRAAHSLLPLDTAAIRSQLRKHGSGGDDSAEPMTAITCRLVAGQLSRHADGAHNRDQT